MNEASYTSSIHERLPPEIYKWKIRDDYCGGVPDAFYRCINGHGKPLWVEYKFEKAFPKRDSTIIKPKLSAQQRWWLEMADKAGEQALVVVGFDDTKNGLVLQVSELDGIKAAEAKHRLLNRNEIAKLISDTTKNT